MKITAILNFVANGLEIQKGHVLSSDEMDQIADCIAVLQKDGVLIVDPHECSEKECDAEKEEKIEPELGGEPEDSQEMAGDAEVPASAEVEKPKKPRKKKL